SFNFLYSEVLYVFNLGSYTSLLKEGVEAVAHISIADSCSSVYSKAESYSIDLSPLYGDSTYCISCPSLIILQPTLINYKFFGFLPLIVDYYLLWKLLFS